MKFAAVARDEWKQTRSALKGKLWLKHVKGHSDHEWNDRADALANLGRSGAQKVGAPIGGLVVD